jgi:magnesium transporter
VGIRKVNNKKFEFVNIANPPEDVLKELKERYDFNPLDLEDFTNKTQVVKIESYKNYDLIVLDFPVFTNTRSYIDKNDANESTLKPPMPIKFVKSTISNLLTIPAATLSATFTPPPYPKKKRIFYSQVYFFIGKDYLVVLHDNELDIINDIFKICHDDPQAREDLMGNGPAFLAYRIIDALVDMCFPMLNEISSIIDKIDRELEIKNSQSILEDVSVTRRNLVYFQTMIKPAVPIFKLLEEGKFKELNGELKKYWGNLYDHVQKLWDRLEDSSTLIEGISDSNESLIVIKSNEVMKVLTLVFTFTIPATVLGTFYGMNVVLPGGLEAGRWTFFGPYTTFFIIMTLSVTFFCLMLLYFKHKRWF